GSPPTTSGFVRSSGFSSSSTAAKNASRSRWATITGQSIVRTVVEIPADVARFALRRGVEGRTWLARLPAIVAECSEQWELELDEVVPASYSLVAMTRRADGSPAVLKVTFPEPEGQHEAEALRLWNGDGIVLLYEADPERSAL